VKGLVLVSTPGRPVVDVVADGLTALYDPAAADQYRRLAGEVQATGTLPRADQIPARLQSVLGQGQEQLLKGIFSVDPVAEARGVKVPTMLVIGAKSTTVKQVDADRLAQAIGAKTEVAVSPEGPTLREAKGDPPPIAFDPSNEATHVFGARPVTDIPRDQAAIDRIASYVGTTLKAGT
jgi:pimeloyl-ACP methyl ester carboxylesterase